MYETTTTCLFSTGGGFRGRGMGGGGFRGRGGGE